MRTTFLTAVVVVLCAATASAQSLAATSPPASSPLATARAAGDFDGDGKTDLAVFRPDTGTWYIAYSSTNYSTSSAIQWGLPGDIPVAGDYEGTGVAEVAVYRYGYWMRRPGGSFTVLITGDLAFVHPIPGASINPHLGDLPVPGDYDGDGKMDVAAYSPRPTAKAEYVQTTESLEETGKWVVLLSSSGYRADAATHLHFGGGPGDIPAPADYDGDGRTDMAIYNWRTGLWRVLYARSNFNPNDTTTWQAAAGGTPAPADYDGDGRADVAVWMGDPAVASHAWSVHLSSSNTDIAVTFGQAWDVPIAGDYDGDGRADMALFRPSTGTVAINTAASDFTPTSSFSWGAVGDVFSVGSIYNNASGAVRARSDLQAQTDLDGDSFSDMTVFRPATREWFTLYSGFGWTKSKNIKTQWFPITDTFTPLLTDFDGDGLTDTGVFLDDHWWDLGTTQVFAGWWRLSLRVPWGLPGDIPVPADYDGTGFADVAVYRPSTGGWYIRHITGIDPMHIYMVGRDFFSWGLEGDIPVPADYDGDGKTDIAVFRPANGMWYILQSSQNHAPLEIQFGLPGDVPMPGDYLGNGRAQVAVYRPSAGFWYTFPDRVRPTQWGTPGDIPVLGDFDGDRRLDFTVFRPLTGEWLVLMSRSKFTTFFVRQWGMPGDIPLPRSR